MSRAVPYKRLLWSGIASTVFLPLLAVADGIIISKIYDPYVQPLETEIEFRSILQSDDQIPDTQKHSIGFGRSLSDRWAVELYAIGLNGPNENLSVDTYELEAKWQLTEQGEYAFDWGLLFELEREIEENAWEFSTQMLVSRDWGKVSAIANIGVIYEWGERIQNEVETTLRVQTRYRLREAFEPAFELHMGQDTKSAGPALTGLVRISNGKKLRWELGLFAGLDEKSPDRTVKANIEFEF
jgi:hypothetical protein